MTAEQIGLYKAVVDSLIEETEMTKAGSPQKKVLFLLPLLL